MVRTFAESVRLEIDENIVSIDNALTQGGVKTIEEYRFLTGQRLGLEVAKRIIDERVRAAERE